MLIKFSPVRMNVEKFILAVDIDSIMINGDKFDFSSLNEGDVLPAGAVDSQWVIGEVTRREGQVELTIVLPHGPNAPHERRFPDPVSITEAGKVDLPPYDEPPTQPGLPELSATDEVANGND